MARILIPENPMERNVLAAIRALGRRGHKIDVAYPVEKTNSKRLTLEKLLKSRYIRQVNYIPDPLITPSAFIEQIIKLLKERDYDLLMPFTSRTFPLISLHSEELKKYANLICADFEIYSKANDKEKISSIAKELGLFVPRSICPSTVDELKEQISHLEFPVVVKARVNCGMQKGLRYAYNMDELIRAYSEISRQESIKGLQEFDRPLIQEYIPGKIYDALYYYNNGSLIAYFTQCREITIPLSGGPGVQNISIKDKKLYDYGKTLLDALNWHGPAMVEVMLDRRDKQYKLLEINPKFWGTLDLSMKCGVNFPEIALDLACYGKLQNEEGYDFQEGLGYRWPKDFVKAHRAAGHSRKEVIKKMTKRVEFNNFDYNDLGPTAYNIIGLFMNLFKNSDRFSK